MKLSRLFSLLLLAALPAERSFALDLTAQTDLTNVNIFSPDITAHNILPMANYDTFLNSIDVASYFDTLEGAYEKEAERLMFRKVRYNFRHLLSRNRQEKVDSDLRLRHMQSFEPVFKEGKRLCLKLDEALISLAKSGHFYEVYTRNNIDGSRTREAIYTAIIDGKNGSTKKRVAVIFVRRHLENPATSLVDGKTIESVKHKHGWQIQYVSKEEQDGSSSKTRKAYSFNVKLSLVPTDHLGSDWQKAKAQHANILSQLETSMDKIMASAPELMQAEAITEEDDELEETLNDENMPAPAHAQEQEGQTFFEMIMGWLSYS